jgi:hypothetical protein
MPTIKPQSHGGVLKSFKKGESKQRARQRTKAEIARDKFLLRIKDYGFSWAHVKLVLESLPGATKEEVARVAEDETQAIVVRTIAKALGKSLELGDLSVYEKFWDRMYGKPKITYIAGDSEPSKSPEVKIDATDPNEAARQYQLMLGG